LAETSAGIVGQDQLVLDTPEAEAHPRFGGVDAEWVPRQVVDQLPQLPIAQ
jgi:hypothetical protein